MPLEVKIITQERQLYEGEADMVILPGIEGEMGILPHHAPLLSRLTIGMLRLRHNDEEHLYAIHGGIVEVQPDRVVVLADMAERSDEIDEERAEAAKERIDEMLKEGPPADPGETAAFEAALRRAEVRLKVAHRRRHHPGSVSIRTPENR